MRQYWVAPLPPLHTASGTALTAASTLTDISPIPNIVLPANILEAGSEFEIRAMGEFTTTGTPNLTLGIYFGGIAGIALAASAVTAIPSAATAWPWQIDYRGVVRTIGTTGSINGQGRLYLGTSLIALSTIAIPATQALRTVTVDTTSAKAVTIGALWSAASNSITCNDISVKLVS